MDDDWRRKFQSVAASISQKNGIPKKCFTARADTGELSVVHHRILYNKALRRDLDGKRMQVVGEVSVESHSWYHEKTNAGPNNKAF